jgi:HSP20 family protein
VLEKEEPMTLLPVQRNHGHSHGHPLGEVKRLQRELTRLVDSSPAFTTFFGDTFAPVATVTDLEDAYVAELELPDVERDAVAISIAARRLSVSGSLGATKRSWFRRRRSAHLEHFSYEMVFPGSVEEEQVTAALDGNLLTVRAPKPTGERRRRIDLQ